MLVVVALTVLMMTIIAQIFQATTGAIQIARAYQEIDQDLRAIEGTIKRDLEGITAKLTPPLNPKDGLGYFEYGENELADAQGEDSDDYLAFTTASSDGNLFNGRYLPPAAPNQQMRAGIQVNPVTITSDTAEVVYFLRNGNLYRRVFLVKPNLKLYHEWAFNLSGTYAGVNLGDIMPGFKSQTVGWQALNDISARPCEYVNQRTAINNPSFPLVFDNYPNKSEVRPEANTLNSLTNRENRAFKPRFANDYWTKNLVNGTFVPVPDGIPDDFLGASNDPTWATEGNLVNDYTPATYPKLLSNPSHRIFTPYGVFLSETTSKPNGYVYPPITSPVTPYDLLAFPFVYPNAYSRTANGVYPYANLTPSQGVIHGIALEYPSRRYNSSYNIPTNALWNHNPLLADDNLVSPGKDSLTQALNDPNQNSIYQTWWGFPTWREQLSPFWIDPLKRLNAPFSFDANIFSGKLPTLTLGVGQQSFGISWNEDLQPFGWLPEMISPTRTSEQPFYEQNPDVSGANSYYYSNRFGNLTPQVWDKTWEDELLATNVRSFDVKAFEPSATFQKYVDLGYQAQETNGLSILGGILDPVDKLFKTTSSIWLQGFGHEGRMPPLKTDLRLDAQYPYIPGGDFVYLGDDDTGVIRLRRVWDTWSTDYSAVDAKTNNPLESPPFKAATRPSYPAPYPAPLRGIQIQIRVTDPRQERVRTITIHQDFTSKL